MIRMVMSDVKKEIYKGIDSYSARVTMQIAESKRDLNQGKFKRTFITNNSIFYIMKFAFEIYHDVTSRDSLILTLLRRSRGPSLSVKLVRR